MVATLTRNVVSSVIEEAEAVVADSQRPKRTPLDVAVFLLGNRWLKGNRQHFQEEVGYAQLDIDSGDRELRSQGFERIRELINQMNDVIRPRRAAALAWRQAAERIDAELGCGMEEAFRLARQTQEGGIPAGSASRNTNTAAKKAQQLSRKRLRTPAAKSGGKGKS